MPFLGSSNSAANKNNRSKNMDKWRNKYLTEQKKTLWEKEKLLLTSNFFFSHNVFKSCLLLMCQNEYLWSKGLKSIVEKGENAGKQPFFFCFPIMVSKASLFRFVKSWDCMVQSWNVYQTKSRTLTNLRKKAFKNIVGKIENDGNQHFVLLSTKFWTVFKSKIPYLENHLNCHM